MASCLISSAVFSRSVFFICTQRRRGLIPDAQRHRSHPRCRACASPVACRRARRPPGYSGSLWRASPRRPGASLRGKTGALGPPGFGSPSLLTVDRESRLAVRFTGRSSAADRALSRGWSGIEPESPSGDGTSPSYQPSRLTARGRAGGSVPGSQGATADQPPRTALGSRDYKASRVRLPFAGQHDEATVSERHVTRVQRVPDVFRLDPVLRAGSLRCTSWRAGRRAGDGTRTRIARLRRPLPIQLGDSGICVRPKPSPAALGPLPIRRWA